MLVRFKEFTKTRLDKTPKGTESSPKDTERHRILLRKSQGVECANKDEYTQ